MRIVSRGDMVENDLTALWAQTCRFLKNSLSQDVYERWIAVIEPKSIDGETLLLGVANDFYQTWLEENYLPLIEKAASASSGNEYRIKLVVDQQHKKTEAAPAPVSSKAKPARKPAGRESRRAAQSIPLNPKYSFENFVVGSSNNFAHAATMAVAQSPARAYNPLFIYGGVGLGKTHLMQAIGNHVQARNTSRISYLSCEAFTNDYIDALQRKGLTQFRKKYRSTDLLLIDDIQFLGGKERMQEEFFHTFNALFDGHKQIVMTCDRPASEIPGLEHRLVSRFEWGLVVELEPPDIETRIAILRKKQEQMNLPLADDILNYIAENIRSNIRRLEGALIKASSFASLTGQSLTLETVENLLRDTIDQVQHQPISIEMIQRMVADYFDIRLADMTSRKRPQSIALPRQVAMYLCRSITGNSLPMIGNAFCRNHATVIHACRLVQNRIKEDGPLRRDVDTIRHKLDQAGHTN